ncbi:GNAT family N-acetyltransferase [Pengzhenrongella frigida]|uniref:N-acetyltransferase n=1 Tax=Pengzhenrongella frigida TaxID=1259133 RepID=A0A4Q5MZF8_9MICO|nr:GNAT family protein [Cellulomonas sp. HLT2-17]RYV49617.1 N-acetyltransferase [Cellulomonas sp. HLT2-17]
MAELQYPMPPLADTVVLLRPWRTEDVPGKLMAFGDPLVQQFAWSRTTAYTEADARDYFVEQETARRAGHALTVAVADPRDEATILGGASLYDVDRETERAGIGYWLAPEARGRGAATHTVRLLAGWAFSALGMKRITLTCGPDNDASQRVAGRCGFVREGVLRSDVVFKGGRRDSVVFSLLPGELR